MRSADAKALIDAGTPEVLVELSAGFREHRVKASLLDVPVVRTRAPWREGDPPKPIREDGRADGARVRIEELGPRSEYRRDEGLRVYEPGVERVIVLAKVLEPWTPEHEEKMHERTAALLLKESLEERAAAADVEADFTSNGVRVSLQTFARLLDALGGEDS